jgi:flavin-dependent dehydrogenase
MPATFDAVIIGAGPAGSTAAILLVSAGWSVALLEAESFPRRKVCGECIAASNLPLLDALGIGDALRHRAGPELRRVAVWCGDESISAALPAADGAQPWGRALGREHLDLLLLERARVSGAVVLQPCKALSLRAGEDGVGREVQAVSRGDGRKHTLRAAVVIRAHGSWGAPPAGPSALEHRRERLRRRPSDLLAFKATFRGAGLDAGLLPVLAFAGGYGGMVMAGNGLATLACCIRRDTLAACRHDGLDGTGAAVRAGEVIEALLRKECRGVRDALAGAHRVGPWLAAGPIRPGVRLGRADRGAFLIGNAAGEVHPIVGEGISMALQSAWLLCAELTGSADAARLDMRGEMCRRMIQRRYAARWRAHFSLRLRLAACFAHAAMRPRLSSPLLPLLRRVPALLGIAAYASGKTRSIVVSPPDIPPGAVEGSAT